MNAYVSRLEKGKQSRGSCIMLYVQYARMMTSQCLYPEAINKYFQGAEEEFYLQSILKS